LRDFDCELLPEVSCFKLKVKGFADGMPRAFGVRVRPATEVRRRCRSAQRIRKEPSDPVTIRSKALSWRLLIPLLLLTAALAITGLWPSASRAYVRPGPGAAANTSSATIESWLVGHGLMGRGMVRAESTYDILKPPPGVEVDVTREFETSSGQQLMLTKSWNETVANDTIHIEVTTLPSQQHEVGFWVFPNHHKGCAMFGWTLYNNGRPLKSTFWRNDPALRLAGAGNLPRDLYPEAIPPMAFLRVLGTPRDGAEGTLHQQLSPYTYMGQNVWASDVQTLNVPAGSFSALKVTAQADVGTLMPNWPTFVLHIIRPFVPKNVIYFQSTPPYRLLRQQGTTFVGGPEVTTELIRFYTAGPQPIASR
jgi:hypothetical protein